MVAAVEEQVLCLHLRAAIRQRGLSTKDCPGSSAQRTVSHAQSWSASGTGQAAGRGPRTKRAGPTRAPAPDSEDFFSSTPISQLEIDEKTKEALVSIDGRLRGHLCALQPPHIDLLIRSVHAAGQHRRDEGFPRSGCCVEGMGLGRAAYSCRRPCRKRENPGIPDAHHSGPQGRGKGPGEMRDQHHSPKQRIESRQFASADIRDPDEHDAAPHCSNRTGSVLRRASA